MDRAWSDVPVTPAGVIGHSRGNLSTQTSGRYGPLVHDPSLGGVMKGAPCPWSPLLCVALAQEREDALRGLVGLREHARAGLLQDLELRELDHLSGHVHVADPALGRHQVLLVRGEVVEAMLEAVFGRAGAGARRPD